MLFLSDTRQGAHREGRKKIVEKIFTAINLSEQRGCGWWRGNGNLEEYLFHHKPRVKMEKNFLLLLLARPFPVVIFHLLPPPLYQKFVLNDISIKEEKKILLRRRTLAEI